MHSHVWMGIGAWSCYQLGLCAIGDTASRNSATETAYGWLLFCATISLYSFHRTYSYYRSPSGKTDGRWLAIRKYQTLMLVGGVVAGVGALYAYWLLPDNWRLRTTWAAILGLLYVLPIVAGQRLRDFGLLKPAFLALGWVGLTLGVPFSFASPLEGSMLGLVFCERVLFMLAHTLPFDVRDAKVDLKDEVITVAQRLGRTKTHKLGICLLCTCLLLQYLYIATSDAPSAAAVYSTLLLTTLMTMFATHMLARRKTSSPLAYNFVLDGVLVLCGVGLFWG